MSLDPAFDNRPIMSSLETRFLVSIAGAAYIRKETHRVISMNLAVKNQLVLHSAGNTLPCSVSCV